MRIDEVLDAGSVVLSWQPVLLPEWEVAHYTIYYSTHSTHLRKTVDQRTVLTTSTDLGTSKVFHITHTDLKFEHRFQVTASIQVEGEEFQSQRSTLLIFNFGKKVALSPGNYFSNLCIPIQMQAFFSYGYHQLIIVSLGM